MVSWSGRESGGNLRANEQFGYGYDSADNLYLRTNNTLVQTFNVDSLNQLSNVLRAGNLTLSGALPVPSSGVSVNGLQAQTNTDFTFARTNLLLSNGTNIFSVAATNVYGFTATNNLVLNLPTNVIFQYDGNGNLTNDGTRVFVYDLENQLTNVSVPGQWKTEFVYDGLRRLRISRDYVWQGGAWTRTNETRRIYDGMLVVQERNSNNVPQAIYTRGLDISRSLHGAGGIGGLLARTDTNGSTFYHADGIGNVTALIDGNQNILARYEYDAFGRLIGKWGTMADVNHYRFSSMEFIPTAGIYGYPRRFYDSNLQRWINSDPIGELGGVNLYRFVGNSPVGRVDPLGLWWWDNGYIQLGVPQIVHDLFYGPNYQDPTPAPDSQLALDGQAGIGPTPLTDGQGNTMKPGDLLQQTALDAAAQVAMLPIGGPEDEGAYAAAEKALAKAAEDAAKVAKCVDASKSLPNVSKAVNSNLPHAAEQAAARGVFDTAADAAKALRDLSESITQNGFPAGTLPDTAYADRVLVPIGDNGLAVYQVGANGTAKLKTVLIAH